MPTQLTKKQLAKSLSALEKKLNRFFGHSRIREVQSSKMSVGRKPAGAKSLLSAIRVLDGTVTEAFISDKSLSLKPGKARVETTTTTVFDDDGMQVETLIKVWEKGSS